ncbi:MAG: class I SAM-dependent methyltransferase [Pseudomonadota bacterium]
MSDRKLHWEKIYSEKTAREVSWYQKKPALSLQLIHDTGLAHDAPIIDVGGGSSELVDYLCAEGYNNLSVLDISANALAYAQHRLGDNANLINWYDVDITRFIPPRTFSLWHDRAVFHFLTEKSDRISYIKVLKRALASNGHLIIAAFALGGPTKCSGLDIVQYDSEKLLDELGEEFRLVENKIESHFTPANVEQKFAYFYFIRA